MDKLGIGVLGAASIARRRMLPAMAAAPDVRIAAVGSRTLRPAAELAGRYDCRAVVGYSAVLALPDVDAVYIPLPLALHAEWTQAALRAGKHVLAEKPLAMDPWQTRELLDLAASRRLVLMENVMFTAHSQHSTVRRLVADGHIGEMRSFHATFAVPRLPDDDIRYQPALGGGALWDTGIYPVRAALYFLGAPLTVAGAVLSGGSGRPVDTAGAVLLHRPAGGVTAQLTFGLDDAYASRYELRGSLGEIAVDHAFSPPADHVPTVRIRRGARVEELRLAPDDQVAGTLGAFVAAVRAGSLPAAATDTCLRQAELLHDVRRWAESLSSLGVT